MRKFFVIFIVASLNLFAQNQINLEKALNIALNESYEIKSAQFSLLSSQKSLEAMKLGLLSSVNMEFDIPSYSRSLSSQFNTSTGRDEFFKVGSTKYEGRLFVNQPLIFSNGNISLVGSIYRRDQFVEGQDDIRDYFTNLSIRLNQPLFAYNTQKASLERAEINLRRSERNYTRAERNIIYRVTASFFNLYKSKKEMEIQTEKVKQNEISFETANNKFKAGLIAEVEKLQLEVDLASSRNQLLDAKRNYQESKNNFKLLIGLELDEEIDVIADIEDFNPVNINLDEAVSSALSKRAELLNQEEDIELGEMEVEETDDRRAIKANITANYGINKNDEELKSLFNEFEDNRRVVLTLSVPVFDWGQNAREVESAEANLKLTMESYRNMKKSIKKEVISSYNRLISAEERVKVLSKSVIVAEKSYEISLERFKSGKITSFDLSQMQIKLTDTKLSSLSALIDYKIALADLERKTYLNYN